MSAMRSPPASPELVRSGNQQAIAFRPAFETGIDSALNTDTFRAIFRGAIKILHSDLLNGASGGSGLNLSESVSVVASTLQLSGSDPSQELSKGSFAGSFSDVTKKLGDLGLWDLQDTISTIALIALGVAAAAAIGAVALAAEPSADDLVDRLDHRVRRRVRRRPAVRRRQVRRAPDRRPRPCWCGPRGHRRHDGRSADAGPVDHRLRGDHRRRRRHRRAPLPGG